MLKSVIIISPHPDDETLGAGGTILKYKDSGYKIYWLNITDMKEKYGFSKEKIKERKAEIEKVLREYKFDGFFDLGLKPAALDEYPLHFLTEEIERVFKKIKPDTVILPYKNDIHSDHRIVFESAYACTKAFRNHYIRKVLMMEILSETDMAVFYENFSPNCFIDISDYLERKIEITKIYKTEYGNHPFPRSPENIRSLAIFRGAMAGCKYAEAFMVLKEID